MRERAMYLIQVERADTASYWRVLAPNGKVLLTSHTYATHRNAYRAAKRFWWSVNRETPVALEDAVDA